MADVHSKQTRSYNISRIRSTHTRPEMLVRKFLHANGYRYTLHNKSLPGRPDIVMPKYKTIVFIHGCFWHGHKFEIRRKRLKPFWVKKIQNNMRRDRRNKAILKRMGWQHMRIWEYQLKRNPNKMVQHVLDKLRSSKIRH